MIARVPSVASRTAHTSKHCWQQLRTTHPSTCLLLSEPVTSTVPPYDSIAKTPKNQGISSSAPHRPRAGVALAAVAPRRAHARLRHGVADVALQQVEGANT